VGATAVLLNIVAVGAGGPGFVSVFPPGGAASTSTVNYPNSAAYNNHTIVRLGVNSASSDFGSIYIANSGASTDIIVDIEGYFYG
jgi:hypothetical protein